MAYSKERMQDDLNIPYHHKQKKYSFIHECDGNTHERGKGDIEEKDLLL
jgi:hypothetical protein